MADILKVTTPLVDKIPQNTIRPAAPDPTMPFNLSDVSRVTQTADPSEILQQNTGLAPGEPEAPRILAQLLSDPAVTASMIGSISLLQEVFNLMPAQNNALTSEIGQLFNQLLLNPEDIVAELMRQEEGTTLFKGKLFDQLRALIEQNPGRNSLATSVGVLLKALNATISRQDVLDSVANNLAFLSDSVQTSPQLSDTLKQLADAFRQPGAGQNFTQLKEQVMDALQQLQNSILFTPQLEKTLPLVIYNLSRYNDNPDFLPDALSLLLSQMNGDSAKLELVNNLQSYLDKVLLGPGGADGLVGEQGAGANQGLPAYLLATQQLTRRLHEFFASSRAGNAVSEDLSTARALEQESKVIDTLANIIAKQAGSTDVQLVSGDKVDKIIESLLASPSNFTPLLHYVVPVQSGDTRAFAEFWIDPISKDDQPKNRRGQPQDNTHMLMVFDVEGVGRFESELYVQNKRIALNLMCPPAYLEEFKTIGPAIRRAVANTGYSFESINIDRLERTHSLMEVFSDLPYKRTGIDVKI